MGKMWRLEGVVQDPCGTGRVLYIPVLPVIMG